MSLLPQHVFTLHMKCHCLLTHTHTATLNTPSGLVIVNNDFAVFSLNFMYDIHIPIIIPEGPQTPS